MITCINKNKKPRNIKNISLLLKKKSSIWLINYLCIENERSILCVWQGTKQEFLYFSNEK